MSADPQAPLKNFKPTSRFFVGIDSDGCVFDTMEIKQKECFTPNTVKYWHLQSVAKYARESAEFVNLYSKWRGANRFPALVKALELLAERPEVKARGFKLPDITPLKRWIETENKLGNPALEELVKKNPDPILKQTLEWSKAINAAIADMVFGVPPFPLVRESLKKLQGRADAIVVSQTPGEALVREWAEHDLTGYVAIIAGQEMGTKADHLRLAAHGKYERNRTLMIGDALGDLKAAQANDMPFFPVNPGKEEASWERFHREALDRFLAGNYTGDYEAELIKEFESYLPETPPWKRG